MPTFSKRSMEALRTCHPLLQEVLSLAIEITDCTVLEGYRTAEQQNLAYARGTSKVLWPHGKHNKKPSLAADVVPYPIDWTNTAAFHHLAGVIKGIAHAKGIIIRWGGDWESFKDMPHYEVVVRSDD